jgi:hypothetical protein
MKFEFMFLSFIVPDPEAPGPRINVILKLLIEELKQLWIGVEVNDCCRHPEDRVPRIHALSQDKE